MLGEFRAERLLLEGDLSGMSVSEIRDVALMAWGDRRRAHSFATAVYQKRIRQRWSRENGQTES